MRRSGLASRTLLQRPIRDMRLVEGMTSDGLVAEMGAAGGFSARAVARGVDILERIFTDEAYTVFLSFPACIMATGLRGALTDLVKRGLVDAIVTAGGTLDHDLSRAWGGTYYGGSFQADDVELHKAGIHRLGNIFIPMHEHGPLIEARLQPLLAELQAKRHRYSVRELCQELGSWIESPDSLLRAAYEAKVPIYSLGVLDSAFGSQLFMFAQTHEFQVDFWKDMSELTDLVFGAERSGALIIGGGISKHTVIWYNQFRDGLDSAVFLTTALEYDGSLSGARLREAISWGKVKEDADEVTVDGEATVLLPLMLLAAYERIAKRK